MKLVEFALVLAATTLPPSLASAGDVDSVLASFERDMNYETSTQVSPAALAEVDPLREALVAALASPKKTEIRAMPIIVSQSTVGAEPVGN